MNLNSKVLGKVVASLLISFEQKQIVSPLFNADFGCLSAIPKMR
jgi:hypothetical protein